MNDAINREFQELRISVGAKLHNLRAKNKLSLEKVAFQTDISTSKLDDLELGKGQIDFGILCQLARFYKCSLKDFL